MPKMKRDVRNFSYKDIDLVHHLVEKCLLLYMKPSEVVNTLHHRAKIEPVVTERILERLEQMNPQFFRAYRLRLALKEQISRFNQLLQEMHEVTKHTQMSQIRAVPTTLANGFQTHPMNYSTYQNQTHVVPSVASGNSQNMMNAVRSYYGVSELSQQASMGNAVGMQGHTGMADVRTNMLMNQGSNAGMMRGYNGVDSQVMFGQDNGFIQPYSNANTEASAPLYSGGDINHGTFPPFSGGFGSNGVTNGFFSPYGGGVENHRITEASIPTHSAGVGNHGITQAPIPTHSAGVGNHGIIQAPIPTFNVGVGNQSITEASVPLCNGVGDDAIAEALGYAYGDGVRNNSITGASVTPYNGVPSRPLAFRQAMPRIEETLLGNSRQMNRTPSLSDSTNGFNNCNGTLGNYSSPPVLESNARIIAPQQGIRMSEPMSGLYGYGAFRNDEFNNEDFHSQ